MQSQLDVQNPARNPLQRLCRSSVRAWPSAAGSRSAARRRRQPETNRQSARQGEGKHLTPYLINSNRHINNRVSTCTVIGNPPVNMLPRPDLECSAEAGRQGRVRGCTGSLGAVDGLGAGSVGTKLWNGVLAYQEHHSSLSGMCYMRAKPSPLPEGACSNH